MKRTHFQTDLWPKTDNSCANISAMHFYIVPWSLHWCTSGCVVVIVEFLPKLKWPCCSRVMACIFVDCSQVQNGIGKYLSANRSKKR